MIKTTTLWTNATARKRRSGIKKFVLNKINESRELKSRYVYRKMVHKRAMTHVLMGVKAKSTNDKASDDSSAGSPPQLSQNSINHMREKPDIAKGTDQNKMNEEQKSQPDHSSNHSLYFGDSRSLSMENMDFDWDKKSQANGNRPTHEGSPERKRTKHSHVQHTVFFV